MPEIVYCYTCNRGQPLQVQSTGLRVCSVCQNDELGETIDPALTGGRTYLYPNKVPVPTIDYQAAAPKSTPPAPSTYATIAAEIAATVTRKNKAYGDSFAKVTRVLELMFPNGVPVEAYADLGGIVRTLDKLFRVATDRDALEENPWGDIAGYALLAIRRVEADKGRA